MHTHVSMKISQKVKACHSKSCHSMPSTHHTIPNIPNLSYVRCECLVNPPITTISENYVRQTPDTTKLGLCKQKGSIDLSWV